MSDRPVCCLLFDISTCVCVCVCVCVVGLQLGGPEMRVLSSDLSKDQMEKRLIYSSMAATGFRRDGREGCLMNRGINGGV